MKISRRLTAAFLSVLLLFSLSVPALAAGAPEITVSNNAEGTKDTVVVKGLRNKELVKVYSDSAGVTLLATARATYSGSATVKIAQLGEAAGTVYLNITSADGNVSEMYSCDYDAEQQTEDPDDSNIVVTNCAEGSRDNITITSLKYGDKVRVYADAALQDLLGSTKATSAGKAIINIEQLGPIGGIVYITNTTFGKLESNPVAVSFDAEQQTIDLDPELVTITNNAAGTRDTVAVKGLKYGDRIQVYSDRTKTTLLGSRKATSNGTVTIKVDQLGANGGTIYISCTAVGSLESDVLAIAFDTETQADVVDADTVTVKNNAEGTKDVVTVTGLKKNDVIRLYTSDDPSVFLGSGVASATGKAVVSVSQLGASGGTVLVTRTGYGLLEGDPVSIAFEAEGQSEPLSAANYINVTNNSSGVKDTLFINSLTKGDVIRVYGDAAKTILLGSSMAKMPTLTVSISQLGVSGGIIYITRAGAGLLESEPFLMNFMSESQSPALTAASDITVSNNIEGIKDTVVVKGLERRDRVRVYKDPSKNELLGSASVPSTSSNGTATVKIAQLGTLGGNVYVTVTSYGEYESDVFEVSFEREGDTEPLDVGSAIVINNYKAGVRDTVLVGGLKNGDVIRVYSSGDALLGSATAGSTGSAMVRVSQLGASGGTISITVTSWGRLESEKYDVNFGNEQSDAPDAAYISVANNGAGLFDSISVLCLTKGDKVNAYKFDGVNYNLIGSGTAGSSGAAHLRISQLGEDAGELFITSTSTNKFESDYTRVTYKAEKSTPINESDVTVTNNAVGTADTVEINGLLAGDTVYIYSDRGALIAIGTESSNSCTISIPQLDTAAGTISVSRKSTGQLESLRTDVDFLAE